MPLSWRAGIAGIIGSIPSSSRHWCVGNIWQFFFRINNPSLCYLKLNNIFILLSFFRMFQWVSGLPDWIPKTAKPPLALQCMIMHKLIHQISKLCTEKLLKGMKVSSSPNTLTTDPLRHPDRVGKIRHTAKKCSVCTPTVPNGGLQKDFNYFLLACGGVRTEQCDIPTH